MRIFVAVMGRFIDTHTHITDEAFDGDREGFISRAIGAGVEKMLLPDIDSTERSGMLEEADAHPGVLFPMAGLYPGSVGANWKEELALVEKTLSSRKVVAIGEIGLDYHFSTQFAGEQREVFRLQLELAAKYGLPVNIHLRDATEDFFSIMEDCRHLGIRGNLHAFGGSRETFRRLRRYGEWSIGVGGIVTFKNAALAETVKYVPLEHILLETDAPYMTPAPHRGTRNESAYIPIVAAKIAELKGIDIEEVAAVTTENAEKLFAL